MSPWAWVFDPHSGGTEISPKLQEETRQRILAAAKKSQIENFTRLEIRFRGPFCYIDAWETASDRLPTHICRLRYFSGRQRWSLAFYTYSHEKYEPSFFRSGKECGTPEEAWETVGSIYLG